MPRTPGCCGVQPPEYKTCDSLQGILCLSHAVSPPKDGWQMAEEPQLSKRVVALTFVLVESLLRELNSFLAKLPQLSPLLHRELCVVLVFP